MSESGGGGGAKVSVQLVVDDRATSTTEQLKESLKGGNEELEKGKEHSEGLGKELLKAEIYVELFKKGAELVAEGIHQAWEMAEKLADASMEAADEANQQVRASAGLFQLIDKGAHSMGELRDYAKDVREELEQAGTKAGVSTGQMEEMFNTVMERGNRTSVEAKELTEQMAMVGKVVPGGMNSLAEGFNMMELGIVRARNPLVQLIAATGELHGNAKSVAQQMQHMTPAEQIEKATAAIEKQAEKMKAGGAESATFTPTLPELKASFGNIREGFLEAIGQPMLDKIIPPLVKLRDFLSEHSEQIRQYGEEIGTALGNFAARVEGALGEIYSGAVEDWDEITGNVEAAEANLRDAWGIIVGDSETVHHHLKDAAKDISSAFETVTSVVKATAETFEDIGQQLVAAFQTIRGISELIGGDFENAGKDLSAMTTKWGSASRASGMAAMAEDVSSKSDEVGGGSTGELDEAIRKYRNWAQAAGADAAQVDAWTTGIREHHAAVEAAANALKDKVDSGDTDYIGKYLNSAIAQQQTGSEKWAFDTIAQSDAMTRALLDGAIQVDGGFEALKKVIEEQSPELAAKLKKMGNTIDPTKGIGGHGPSVNFNGGQTFNIKQDFRDQDPDRVMVEFRRDLAKAATSRRGSRMATAFGL